MSALQAMSELRSDSSSTDGDVQLGTTILERYRIERVLAVGGMATIYLAQDMTLERRVALKVLKSQVGKMPELTERFANEARSLARLRSPHVAHVLDYGSIPQGSDAPLPFIVLELLDGCDLWAAIQQNGRMTVPLVARYMIEACEGLAEAHALGIVHRDIKPENLFVSREADGTETVKVLDFGISKLLTENPAGTATEGNETVGSPHYMSPEQMQALPVDARTDIWGLGAVMSECATGRSVFQGATVLEICACVLGAPLPDLRRLNPELPEQFVRVVDRCLERDPADRFQTVAELAQALEPLAEQSAGSPTTRIARLLGTQAAARRPNDSMNMELHEFEDLIRNVPTDHSSPRSHGVVGLSVLLALSGVAGYAGFRHPRELAWIAGEAQRYAASLFGFLSF